MVDNNFVDNSNNMDWESRGGVSALRTPTFASLARMHQISIPNILACQVYKPFEYFIPKSTSGCR